MHAVRCGADAIGFVFAPSPRQVSESDARAIREKLPPFVSAVGIFVDPEPGEARKVFDDVGLDFVQLYTEDERAFLEGSGLGPRQVIRSISIATESDLEAARKTAVEIIHLDTQVKGQAGGTGKTFDWSIAVKAKSIGKPIILSGGLNPDNVAEAIAAVLPPAVDASTGLEAEPGKKDPVGHRECEPDGVLVQLLYIAHLAVSLHEIRNSTG